MTQSWKIESLSKAYRGKSALEEACLELDAGRITGLLGTNGAGKSTLIKCLLGLVHADAGMGVPLQLAGKSIGFLPEIAHVPEQLSARQWVQLALRLRGSRKATADDYLDEVMLQPDAWQQPMRTYSKGMRQRAALAFALAGDPAWLILDEPMSGLDAVGRKQVLNILKQRHGQGCGILICSHIVPDLVRLCDRVVIMARGRIRETVEISEHSMDEAVRLEEKLEQWNRHEAHA